jgi:hypothetical protein
MSSTAIVGQPFPLDPAEIQINQSTSGEQALGSLLRLPDGRYLAVWSSEGPEPADGSGYSIQARLLGFDGLPSSDQFQVNLHTTGHQWSPHAASWPDGSFVIAWSSEGSFGDDQDGFSVQARRFSSTGSPLDPSEFQVNTYTNATQSVHHEGVMTLPSGDFVVVWISEGSWGTDQDWYSIQMRRFDSTGVPLDPVETQVNSYTTSLQSTPHMAVWADGRFVVAWTSDGSFGDDQGGYSVQARRFAGDGAPIDAAEFQVNTLTAYRQMLPDVASMPDGGFVVVWESDFIPGGDPLLGIQARRFRDNGSPRDPVEFQVNTFTPFGQRSPDVATSARGDFAVVWDSARSPGSDQDDSSVHIRRFRRDGSAIDDQEFQVNTYTTGHQHLPIIAREADGDFIVGWASQGSWGSDQDIRSVQIRRFGRPTINVNSASGGTGGPGCMLRDAIAAAQLGVTVGGCAPGNEGAVIRLPAGATIRLFEADDGDNALPLITSSVTIVGAGARIERDPALACPGGPEFRIAEVASGGVLTLEDVTIAGGCLPGGAGGALLARGGTLILRRATVEASIAAFGGGVAIDDGGLDLNESSLVDNLAAGPGGGIALFGAPDRLRIERSTIAGNVAGDGGGIAHLAPFALVPLDLVQSTVSGNFAFGAGGGLRIDAPGAEAILDFVTLTDNAAALGAGVAVDDGVLVSHESLLGGNSPGSDCDFAATGALDASGFNLDTDGSCAAAAGGSFGTVPELGLSGLADHGGSTATHVPLAGSAALEAASACANGPGFPIFADQRGEPRPVDDGGAPGPQCDLGAVEGAPIFLDGFESGDTGAWSAAAPSSRDPATRVSARPSALRPARGRAEEGSRGSRDPRARLRTFPH